jgi:hypothetical protein
MNTVVLLLLWARAASAQCTGMPLSPSGVAVLDTSMVPRPGFSNNERIVFQQKVCNGVASAGRVQFQFTVLGPSGAPVLAHRGNAVPGSVGYSASQLAGIPISGFYKGPGPYTLQAQASLDGRTVTQQAIFTVSSPNILLIYPPNGSTGIAERPLTFRWSSSGSSQYRVTVGDNPSFYNSVFSQTTTGGETSLSYPDNPSDPRQRLAADPQAYYWKVEGLDPGGAVLGHSDVPFSFTLTAASLTKDLAVTGLTVDPEAAVAAGSLGFVISVKNQGGATQTGVPLKFSVGGLAAPGTPIAMPMLAPADGRDFSVTSALPIDQTQSLAVACVEFSDDNIVNNCRTLLVSRPSTSAAGGGAIFQPAPEMTVEQLKQAIWQLIQNNPVYADLKDFDLAGAEGDLSADELKSLLASLQHNLATITVSQPNLTPQPAPEPAQTPAAPAAPVAALPPEAPPPPAAAGFEEEAREWSGMHAPVFDQTQAFAVKTAGAWRRVWDRLSNAPRPQVDFTTHMVLAVVAGRGERVDSIEFEGAPMSGAAELLVRYRLVVQRRMLEPEGPQRAAKRTTVPYLLREAPAAPVTVRFERMEQ